MSSASLLRACARDLARRVVAMRVKPPGPSDLDGLDALAMELTHHADAQERAERERNDLRRRLDAFVEATRHLVTAGLPSAEIVPLRFPQLATDANRLRGMGQDQAAFIARHEPDWPGRGGAA